MSWDVQLAPRSVDSSDQPLGSLADVVAAIRSVYPEATFEPQGPAAREMMEEAIGRLRNSILKQREELPAEFDRMASSQWTSGTLEGERFSMEIQCMGAPGVVEYLSLAIRGGDNAVAALKRIADALTCRAIDEGTGREIDFLKDSDRELRDLQALRSRCSQSFGEVEE
jgi:hypothetical protein